ncbi:c6 zinc finger domain-containing protein [Colletotrichum incanum]|uniref:C6 zinc finger domain-containing protein n=1 Tax=Colletotrichum incanum TaxID=1573173 RepID=A0A162NDY3_COLIC|nr:c6 zinc finger domain-containing protein [Colletotrichum incanum]
MTTLTSRQLALPTTNPAQTATGGSRRQCWECQRRRLVCDSARPVCSKCKISGVVCPGYEDRKPLTWLAPNKIKTRTWKRKSPPTDKSDANRRSPQDEQVEVAKLVSEKQLVHIFPGFEFRTETCDIIEATLYWNEQVYPSMVSTQLSQSPWVIPVSYIHYMQPSIQHALVAMAIEHRMARISHMRNDPFVAEVRSRACQHRSTAVQALNKDIQDERTRISDFTLSSVIVFLYGDLMASMTASNWRFHLNGFAALVSLRGGWEDLCRKTPHLKILVLFCKIIENFANTTSPADDQMSPVSNFELKDLISDAFETGYYPFLPCPGDLFIDIIHVNRLRFLAARQGDKIITGSIESEAEDLLTKITDFSPEAWSETKDESREEHLMMAQVYQSAVVLFAISSLQSAGAVSLSAGWTAVKKIHSCRLLSLLEKSAASPVLKSCTAWPMIVAGFEAKSASPTIRAFILGRMEEESRELGVYLPLAAKEVLERFYSSSGNRWDDCFDSPRALIT